MCLKEAFLDGVENETERIWHKPVLKPETSKRNHRNETSETTETTKTKRKKKVNHNKMNAIRRVSINV